MSQGADEVLLGLLYRLAASESLPSPMKIKRRLHGVRGLSGEARLMGLSLLARTYVGVAEQHRVATARLMGCSGVLDPGEMAWEAVAAAGLAYRVRVAAEGRCEAPLLLSDDVWELLVALMLVLRVRYDQAALEKHVAKLILGLFP